MRHDKHVEAEKLHKAEKKESDSRGRRQTSDNCIPFSYLEKVKIIKSYSTDILKIAPMNNTSLLLYFSKTTWSEKTLQ